MPLDSCLKDGNMEKDLQTVAICNSKKKKKKAQHTKEKTKMITRYCQGIKEKKNSNKIISLSKIETLYTLKGNCSCRVSSLNRIRNKEMNKKAEVEIDII